MIKINVFKHSALLFQVPIYQIKNLILQEGFT